VDARSLKALNATMGERDKLKAFYLEVETPTTREQTPNRDRSPMRTPNQQITVEEVKALQDIRRYVARCFPSLDAVQKAYMNPVMATANKALTKLEDQVSIDKAEGSAQ
jgi:hypothetical protein